MFAAPSFASLPDDVVVAILGGLTLQERHAFAAPVCGRWRRLANCTPQLLRVVSAAFCGGNEWAAARLDSFCAWMLTHAAQHVQRLGVEVEAAKGDAPAGTSEQLAVALAATLAGCGMAGGLTALRLDANTGVGLVWLHGLHSLRSLVLTSYGRNMSWDTPPSALPALEELSLMGWPLELPPSVRLPPSLTKLHLGILHADALLPQVAALPRLHTLSLNQAAWTSSGYDGLTCLASLRRLELQSCDYWPSCLSRLTGLESLALDDGGEALEEEEGEVAAGEIVRHALPLLTRLTWLALDAAPGMAAPPPELASLTNLHSFFWLVGDDETGPLPTGPLPAGPWLSSLQRLAATADTIVASAAALAAASQLEFVGVLCVQDELPLVRALSAALSAPALRRLVCWASKEVLCSNMQTLLHAQHYNPSVRLDVNAYVLTHGPRFFPCCGYDPSSPHSLDAFLAGGA